jgi:hypothetical protein
MVNDEVACVFAITFEDESTWKEKNINKAVYFFIALVRTQILEGRNL